MIQMTKNNSSSLFDFALSASEKLVEIRDPVALPDFIVQQIANFTEAEIGIMVILREQGYLDYVVRRVADGVPMPERKETLSHTILTEVMNSRAPVVLANAMTDQRFSGAESVQRLRIRSVMCIPLLVGQRVLGAIYLENRSLKKRFSKDMLTPVLLFARQAAIATENARLRERLGIQNESQSGAAQEDEQRSALERERDKVTRLNAELERRVAERTQELQNALSELEHFSYTISHNLRSPLRGIDGWSMVLLAEAGDQLSDDARRYLDLLRSNAQQMGYLIDDLVTFLRLKRMPINKEKVDMQDALTAALNRLSKEQEGRKVELRITEMPACYADLNLLTEVYFQLLENALKFTRKREHAIIEIGGQTVVDEQVYYVKDNGVGFDMQYVHKLFMVFERLQRDEEYEGTGAGLASVKRIVLRHGGQVWAESDPGEGATFYFSFPLNPTETSTDLFDL